MATKPNSASSATREPTAFDLAATVGQKVVRLPTAPRRMVQQKYNRASREARRALPQFTGEYLPPFFRNALEQAELIRSADGKTALRWCAAMFLAMDEGAQAKVRLFVAGAAIGGCTDAKRVGAIIDSLTGNNGDRSSLQAAYRYLDGEA